ncbi:hypothetical protein HZC07_00345 [Candidatus Micrarchaeota archaeon]|nr:hypothetical protein [Candidatus Micrarchaeota archaeon]
MSFLCDELHRRSLPSEYLARTTEFIRTYGVLALELLQAFPGPDHLAVLHTPSSDSLSLFDFRGSLLGIPNSGELGKVNPINGLPTKEATDVDSERRWIFYVADGISRSLVRDADDFCGRRGVDASDGHDFAFGVARIAYDTVLLHDEKMPRADSETLVTDIPWKLLEAVRRGDNSQQLLDVLRLQSREERAFVGKLLEAETQLAA